MWGSDALHVARAGCLDGTQVGAREFQAKLANATAEGLIFKNAMCKNATFRHVYLSTECPLLPPLPPLLGR